MHVLNTCDDTQTYISAAYTIPQDVCAPVVMVNNKLNSLYNLAHGGDQLAAWVSDPSFAAYVNGGMYQVNFTLTATPSGLPACDGVTVKSNLTVTITGPNSQDAAQLCVAP